jgi:hypothetical protein
VIRAGIEALGLSTYGCWGQRPPCRSTVTAPAMVSAVSEVSETRSLFSLARPILPFHRQGVDMAAVKWQCEKEKNH